MTTTEEVLEQQPPMRSSSRVDARVIWMPVGLATTVVLAVAGGSVWMNSQLLSINYAIMGVEMKVATGYDKLDARLKVMEGRMNENQGEVRGEMREWVRLFEAQNKGRVNEPLEIPKFP